MKDRRGRLDEVFSFGRAIMVLTFALVLLVVEVQ
jgi:hypothetical protein